MEDCLAFFDKVEALARRVDRWWFSSGSPLPLALLRIGVGSIALLNAASFLPSYQDWFTEDGFVPEQISVLWSGDILFNLMRGVTDAPGALAFLIGLLIASTGMVLGLWSRFFTIATTLATISLQSRNAFILHGGDVILRLMLIYLCFSRCGEALSLDRVWARWRAGKFVPRPTVPLWPQRLIQYQLSIVYLMTVLHKCMSIPWRDGTAVYYVLRLDGYQRFALPSVLSNPPFANLATYGTLVVETMLGLTPFFPALRKYSVPCGILLHASIGYAMNIPLFGELTVTLYLSFFTGEEYERFWRTVQGWFRFNLPVSEAIETTS